MEKVVRRRQEYRHCGKQAGTFPTYLKKQSTIATRPFYSTLRYIYIHRAENISTYPHRNLYTNVHRITIHNSYPSSVIP